MALITRFSPLGNLTDLTTDVELGKWGDEVESLMSTAVAGLERYTQRGKAQFADPSVVDMGGSTAAPISWIGFPASLAAQGFNGQQAYKIADGLMNDGNGHSGRDVQDEYLEWYVHRDAAGGVTQIDFTTEGPEYWDTLVQQLGPAGVLALYQTYYPDATESDLFTGGQYNHDNVFNTTKGAMHLRQAANDLSAEVEIAAQSTLTYTRQGAVLQDGGDLCNYASLGVSTRNSDPHIAQTVNGLARQGRRLSLLNPIGLYMSDAPDFTGWTTPDGSDPAKLWAVERGNPPTRGSLRSSSTVKLSDVTIGAQTIQYGGQVGERISIFLTGLYTAENTLVPTVVPVEHLTLAQVKMKLQAFVLRRDAISRTGR
jgi:hypothetical protein